MKLSNRPVTSREYKLILKGETFKELEHGVEAFWSRVKIVTEEQGGKVVDAPKITKVKILKRRTWYLDTKAFDLRNRYNLVLRVREELKERVKGVWQDPEEKKFKITLKFRDPDRYLSASQNVSVSDEVDEDDIKIKFEEDILPPFRSKFSLSTSVKLKKLPPAFTSPEDPEKPVTTLKQVVAFFPGLADLGLPKSTPIYVVRNFVAHEWAYRVGKLEFDEEIKVCLSFWYDSDAESDVPAVAEFSFDYDVSELVDDKVLEKALDKTLKSVFTDEEKDSIQKILKKGSNRKNFLEDFLPKEVFLEEYTIGVAEGARRLFEAMQEEDGIDLKGTTKTAFAYKGPPSRMILVVRVDPGSTESTVAIEFVEE